MAKGSKVSKGLRDDYDVMFTYGDLHIPRHDRKLCNILIDMITDIQPDIVLDGGDIISADCLSRFPKKHAQLVGLQDELGLAYLWMTRINAAVPGARKILLKDNHFWRRLEDKKKGELWLEELNATSGENLLCLKELGWEAMVEYLWKKTLLFVHGDDRSGSGDCPVNRTRKMVQTNGVSIVRYHTHVTGIETHRHRIAGEIYAIQLGCFENLKDKTGYMKHPEMSNWSTSAGVFYLPKSGNSFHFVPILFKNGEAMFNGVLYR